MKLYYSSPTSPGFLTEIFKKYKIKDFLLSYAVDANHINKFKQFDDVIIDSGAFSVWNKGEKIDITKYRLFCQSKQQLTNKTWHVVNLDVIPKTGSNAKEKDLACEQGFKNFLFLKEKLNNVIPVYHYGDDIKWLKKYLEYTNYIGISPANDTHENIKRKFLDYVFNYLPRDIKTHGFGYTSNEGLKLYPFYSVDSISFKAAALFGNVSIFNEHKKSLYSIHIDEFKKKYRTLCDIKSTDMDLVYVAVEKSIDSIEKFMTYIDKLHKEKDFTYLKSQQSLF